MTAAPGYYSLVQYCPDPSRLETVNIGVVAFSPSLRLLKVRLSDDNDRIRQLFGLKDPQLVVAEKEALHERLNDATKEFQSVDDFEAFVVRRAGAVRVTPLRPMKVSTDSEFLEELFKKLVGERAPRQALRARVLFDKALEKAGIREALTASIVVDVPTLKRSVKAAYGYQNGRFNMIEPVSFVSAPSVWGTACTRAIEGEALYKMQDSKFGKLKLNIIGLFGDESQEQENTVRDLLKANDVGFFNLKNLAPLIVDIRKHHPKS